MMINNLISLINPRSTAKAAKKADTLQGKCALLGAGRSDSYTQTKETPALSRISSSKTSAPPSPASVATRSSSTSSTPTSALTHRAVSGDMTRTPGHDPAIDALLGLDLNNVTQRPKLDKSSIGTMLQGLAGDKNATLRQHITRAALKTLVVSGALVLAKAKKGEAHADPFQLPVFANTISDASPILSVMNFSQTLGATFTPKVEGADAPAVQNGNRGTALDLFAKMMAPNGQTPAEPELAASLQLPHRTRGQLQVKYAAIQTALQNTPQATVLNKADYERLGTLLRNG